MRFTIGGVGIGFLGILRAGEMEFLAGEYVGDGGRGKPVMTLVSSLGGRPRGTEFAPLGDDIDDCGFDALFVSGNCWDMLLLDRSLPNRALNSSADGILLFELIGFETDFCAYPLGLPSAH